MKKLTVLAYSSDTDAIVRRLMDLKCVQIRKDPPSAEALSLERFESDGTRAQTEDRLSRIRAVIPVLAPYSRRKGSIGRRVHRIDCERFVSDGRAARAWDAVVHTEAVLEELHRITEEQTRNESLLHSLVPWLEYDAPLCEDRTKKTVIQLGSCSVKTSPTEDLLEAGAYVECVYEDEKDRYFALTYHREDEDAVSRVLAAHGFVRSEFYGVELPAQPAYDRAEVRVTELREAYLNTTDRLVGLADLLDDIEILCDVEETTLNVSMQKQKLLRTRNCTVLSGWVPEERAEDVLGTLSSFECACDLSLPEEGDEPPVLLRNGFFSSTFEWVIGMYSYPKYGTFDPTFIMSIFYFVIFGMMFADVGYGLLMVIACFGGVKLLNPRTGMKRMLLMFGYCGISCMIMGVLFGGWFGDLPTAIMNSFFPEFGGKAEESAIGSFFYYGLILNPVESSTGFLVIALAMGEVHLIAGMVISMIETWKAGKPLVAICSNLPFWVLFAGLDLMVPSAVAGMLMTDGVPEHLSALFAELASIGGYLAIAGFVLILLLKGVGEKSFGGWLVKGLGGLYSLISFASDLLSYSRILALGLVANVIASVINMLTGLGATGPVGFVFMIIVMIAGHMLNLAINLLGTFVHAARLQYIEFFGKFYEDGGEIFTPEMPAENYSENCKEVSN